MNTIFLFVVLFSVVAVNGNAENCNESSELASTCGNYCFKAMKPVLDHTKYLQSQVNDFNLTKPDNLKKLVDVLIKDKLENVEQKLQDLRKLIETRHLTDRLRFQKIGLKYYYIEKSERLNWFGAAHKCVEMGGHLVSIKNIEEFNAIKQNLHSKEDYWIDINDLTKEGSFSSIATGRAANYFIWKQYEPNNMNNNEHCVELYYDESHRMNDDTCNKQQLFICEATG